MTKDQTKQKTVNKKKPSGKASGSGVGGEGQIKSTVSSNNVSVSVGNVAPMCEPMVTNVPNVNISGVPVQYHTPMRPAPPTPAPQNMAPAGGQYVNTYQNGNGFVDMNGFPQNKQPIYDNMYGYQPGNQQCTPMRTSQTGMTPPYGTPRAPPGFAPPTYQQYNQARQQSPAHSDTNTLIALITKLDSRLQSIETSVSKLDAIQTELSNVKADVCALRTDTKSIHYGINELESACQTISDVTDDFRAHQTNCSKNVDTLVRTNKSLESDVAALKHSNSSLQESVLDLKCRSMRDNLIFCWC